MANNIILLVEDESIEAMDIKRTLELYGYKVPYVASNGEEAVRKALEIMPDLILMDIVLKGEIDGIEAASKIKELNIPVIYLTAHSEDSTIQRAFVTEPYAYILKPFDAKELKFAVELAIYKHESNKKISESEKSYRTLSENLQGIVYRVSLRENGNMYFFNDRVTEMTGYSPEELKHGEVCSIDPLIISEDKENVINTVKNAIKSGKFFVVDYRIKNKDGSIKYFRERGKPVYGDDGKPLYIDGVIFDVTETNNYKLELEKSYKLWKDTFNAIEEGICFIDKNGIIKQCNSAMEALLEKPSNEFMEKKCWEIVHGTDEPPENCPVVKMWKSKKRESLEMSINGEWFKETADPILDDKGKLTGAVHIFTNINERKEAEEALIESKEKYKALFESDPDYTLLVGLDGIIFDVNPAAEHVMGLSKDELLKKNFMELEIFPKDEKPKHKKMFKKLLKDKEVVRYESRIITHSNEIRWLKTALAIIMKDDVPKHILMIHSDITQRKKAIKDLQESLQEKEITSQVVMQLVGVVSTSEIYSIIGKAVKQLLPDSYIIVSGTSANEKNVRIMEIFGPKNFFNKLTTILGIDPYEMEFSVGEISSEELKKHRSEVLTEYKEGFYDLTMKKIPRSVCQIIEKVFHIRRIYSIRFSFEGCHYGGVSIAILEGQSIDHKKAIEIIVHQASIAIRRARAEEAINESLREKDVLLREIHHRVNNNLQIVSSLLSLQIKHVEGNETQNVLKESQGRVKSMAMIHEKLYQSSRFTNINFKEYVEKLVFDIFYSYGIKNDSIKLVVDIEDVLMNMDTAIPLGLIINELVTNIVKYAFSKPEGTITIKLKPLQEQMELTVADDGIGLPTDIDAKNTDTLGFQLVNNLVNQIDGKIEIDRSIGTKFKITFEELKYKKRI
ncbi:MAG: PAS domain S-box protein [Methanobacterium sp.]|uniref:PAS domain S-box protein n=1 Tax=Methanobacterium sp. TaxID=2164 RepID=UPI003D651FE2|nr:PAS domain S-box protein [Methanobacterium sp.]